jgi:AcrR family transcriptional regulator
MSLPKDTFFNLPDEKRQRVIDAAIDEFAERSFHEARVTAIAEGAGIAMGSFYQYFEDKKDLFKYIIELIVKEKLAYINQDMMANMQNYGFFQLLREIYSRGLRFAKERPRLLAIGLSLTNNEALYHEVYGDHVQTSDDFFRKLLAKGIADGDLDPTIDPILVARLLTMLNYALADFIYDDGKLDLDDMEIIDKMLNLIENGIKNRAAALGGC